ncbi:MAG: hypothetical protein RLN90_01235 [Balneolaceae bacterium]
MNRVIVLILFLGLVSCDYYDGRLQIINKSDRVICFDHEVDTILDIPSINKKDYFIRTRINPGDTTNVVLPGSTKQWIWEVASGKDSTLSIYVFDYEQVLKNDWDSLRKSKNYIRYDFPLTELMENNWTVQVE